MRRASKTKRLLCDLSINRAKYFNAYFDDKVKRARKKGLDRIEGELADLTRDGKTLASIIESLASPQKDVDRRRAQYTAIYDKLGRKAPKDLFQEWVPASAGYKAALKAAMKRKMLKARQKLSGIKRSAKAAAKAAGLKLVAYGVVNKTPRIKKNSIGFPLRKIWNVELLTQAKGEKFCRPVPQQIVRTAQGRRSLRKAEHRRTAALVLRLEVQITRPQN